jgi:TonB family protein
MRILSLILPVLLTTSVLGASVEPSVRTVLSMKDTLFAPKPQYPYEARCRHITGYGICVLQVRPDGTVRDATMIRSTGSAILDNATVQTFRRWLFVPGRADEVKIPIRYNSYDIELLTPNFTAAGARTTFNPKPEYPESLKKRGIGGQGEFLMHVDLKTGKVTSVDVLKSTGVAPLDESCVRAFRQWPLVHNTERTIRCPVEFVPDAPAKH